MIKIKELSEKLRIFGEDSLTSEELLALIIGEKTIYLSVVFGKAIEKLLKLFLK